jgi:hypothetical protein
MTCRFVSTFIVDQFAGSPFSGQKAEDSCNSVQYPHFAAYRATPSGKQGTTAHSTDDSILSFSWAFSKLPC